MQYCLLFMTEDWRVCLIGRPISGAISSRLHWTFTFFAEWLKLSSSRPIQVFHVKLKWSVHLPSVSTLEPHFYLVYTTSCKRGCLHGAPVLFFLNFQLQSCITSTTPHCLEWYKLVPRTRLPTPAVRYLVLTNHNTSIDGNVHASFYLVSSSSGVLTSRDLGHRSCKLIGKQTGYPLWKTFTPILFFLRFFVFQ